GTSGAAVHANRRVASRKTENQHDAGGVGFQPDVDLSDREAAILDSLRTRGASFFGPLHEAVGGGDPAETVAALWNLVWNGYVTNDTFHALRAFTRARTSRRRQIHATATPFRSRRLAPPSAEGRWTLISRPVTVSGRPSVTADRSSVGSSASGSRASTIAPR